MHIDANAYFFLHEIEFGVSFRTDVSYLQLTPFSGVLNWKCV